jgi:uncharacterized protein YdcH (DUF465 family)
MVQISTRVLVAALAAAPALAIPLSQSIESGVVARDVNSVELDARAPFFGKIFKGVKSILGFRRDLEEVDARDFEDDVLESREFDELTDLELREFDELVSDLEARNPFFGKIFRGVKSVLGFRRDFEEIDARDFEDVTDLELREFDEFVNDLEARNPFFGKIFKGVKSILGFRRDYEDEIDAREFDEIVSELEARNPFFGKIFRGVKSVLGFRRDVDARDIQDDLLEARDLAEQLTEVELREFDEFVADLEARNPFFGKIFKGVKSILGFRRDYLESEFEARDFDIEEIDARDYFDFEDFEAREIDELD